MVTWFTGQTERPDAEQRICPSVSINKPQNLYMLLIFIVIVLGKTPSRVCIYIEMKPGMPYQREILDHFGLGDCGKRFVQSIDHKERA